MKLIHEIISKDLSELDGDINHRTHSDAQEAEWDSKVDELDVLLLNNTIPFTPDGDYEPATKKYVDDNVGAFSGDMDDIPDGITYVKTENNFTDAEQSKLSGIAAGAEVNVNADWNSGSGDSQILNKPDLSAKQDTLISGTNIKSINSNSLLGSGDLIIAPTINIKETEIDFGATLYQTEKSFTVIDTDVSASSQILANVAYKSPSDGRSVDEIISEELRLFCQAASGQFTLLIKSLGSVNGKFLINYLVG